MKETFHAIEQSLPGHISDDFISRVTAELWQFKQDDQPFRLFDVSSNILCDPHFLGWVLCAVMDEKRRDAYRTNLETGHKSPNVSATTQTFTPRHLVDELLRDLDVGENESVYDPCCGGGQFLLAAFDRKRDQNIDVEKILTLVGGSDIDPIAVNVARSCLKLRVYDAIGKRAQSLETIIDRRVCVADVFGDIPPADIVATNPPFMGRRFMNAGLREQTDRLRPFHLDLYLAVIHRCQELATRGIGIVAPQTLWFLKKFAPARDSLRTWGQVKTFHHLGSGQFPNLRGEKSAVVMFSQLRDQVGETKFFDHKSSATPVRKPMSRFDRIPGAPIAHWLSDAQIEAFERFRPLGDFIEIPSPNKTANNAKYVRPFDDHEFGEWRPYHKGGSYAPWSNPVEWVVDWSESAQAHYANHATANFYRGPEREAIGYIDFASGVFNARLVVAGTIPDMTGPMIFLNEKYDTKDNRLRLLAYLNSSIARTLLVAMNPTVHFQVTDVKRLPIPDAIFANKQLAELAQACVDACRVDSVSELVGNFDSISDFEDEIDRICALLTNAPASKLRRKRRSGF